MYPQCTIHENCFSSKTKEACDYCISNCHQGHNVGKNQHSLFFCDCGYQKKCITNLADTQQQHSSCFLLGIYDDIKSIGKYSNNFKIANIEIILKLLVTY